MNSEFVEVGQVDFVCQRCPHKDSLSSDADDDGRLSEAELVARARRNTLLHVQYAVKDAEAEIKKIDEDKDGLVCHRFIHSFCSFQKYLDR